MNHSLGNFEKQIIDLSHRTGSKLTTTLETFYSINTAKVNCIEIFQSRKEDISTEKLTNCVKKTYDAFIMQKEINDKIFNK